MNTLNKNREVRTITKKHSNLSGTSCCGCKLLRANACKNQAKLKFGGQSRNSFFADILLIGSYR